MAWQVSSHGSMAIVALMVSDRLIAWLYGSSANLGRQANDDLDVEIGSMAMALVRWLGWFN